MSYINESVEFTELDTVENFNLLDNIKKVGNTIGSGVKTVGSGIKTVVTSNEFKSGVKTVGSAVGSGVKTVGSGVKTVGSGVKSVVTSDEFKSGVKTVGSAVGTTVSKVGNLYIDTLTKTVNAPFKIFSWVGDNFKYLVIFLVILFLIFAYIKLSKFF